MNSFRNSQEIMYKLKTGTDIIVVIVTTQLTATSLQNSLTFKQKVALKRLHSGYLHLNSNIRGDKWLMSVQQCTFSFTCPWAYQPETLRHTYLGHAKREHPLCSVKWTSTSSLYISMCARVCALVCVYFSALYWRTRLIPIKVNIIRSL